MLLPLFLISCITENTKAINTKDDGVYLVSDALKGRQTGSNGEQKDAEYIADRFKNIGLEAKGTNSCFQTFLFNPKTDPHQEVNYTVKDGDRDITDIISYMKALSTYKKGNTTKVVVNRDGEEIEVEVTF